ncbi:unnamed protein product [Urochloa humidicola]
MRKSKEEQESSGIVRESSPWMSRIKPTRPGLHLRPSRNKAAGCGLETPPPPPSAIRLGEIEQERDAAASVGARRRGAIASVGAQSERGVLQLLLWTDLQRWLASCRPAAAVQALSDLPMERTGMATPRDRHRPVTSPSPDVILGL